MVQHYDMVHICGCRLIQPSSDPGLGIRLYADAKELEYHCQGGTVHQQRSGICGHGECECGDEFGLTRASNTGRSEDEVSEI